jgi:hypothetical protein
VGYFVSYKTKTVDWTCSNFKIFKYSGDIWRKKNYTHTHTDSSVSKVTGYNFEEGGGGSVPSRAIGPLLLALGSTQTLMHYVQGLLSAWLQHKAKLPTYLHLVTG